MPKVNKELEHEVGQAEVGQEQAGVGANGHASGGFPANLRPYRFYGMDVDYTPGQDHVYVDCPFCGRQGKFSIKAETGQWRCFACGDGTDKGGGNIWTFIRLLWDRSDEATTDYKDLAEERRLLFPDTLMNWGVARSIIDNEWIVPGYNRECKISSLYRYVSMSPNAKRTLIAAPGIQHQIFGLNNWDRKKEIVYVCEGPWDAMALWETMQITKETEEGLRVTASLTDNLLSNANVIAFPGCNVFNDSLWPQLLRGKMVILMYDSDRQRVGPKGNLLDGPGFAGMQRVAKLLNKADDKPRTTFYLRWGKSGFDPNLADGFDVRDYLSQGNNNSSADRVKLLQTLLEKVVEVPGEWIGRKSTANNETSRPVPSSAPKPEDASPTSSKEAIECLGCDSFKILQTSWRKAMKWTEGLDNALAVMLAVSISTKIVGSQLWVKIIGPAACGKSTLCEAMSVNKDYCIAKSTIRGFHSGYRESSDSGEDNSLIALIDGKTLITKDGDTLLQSPNLKQVLSEARDLYDCTTRSYYRNKASKDYEGIRMTWLLCGTSSLREIDASELGARFLDCVIMDGIDDDMEDEILTRVANKAEQNMSLEVGDQIESDPDKAHSMGLTGGYINYLRENARALLNAVKMSEERKRQCIRLGKFVAYTRARPSKTQDETAEREFASRLVEQIIRLAKCLAAVLNKTEIDEEVMRRVIKVALDTARGRTLMIMDHLNAAGRDTGLETAQVAHMTHNTPEKEIHLLRFLRRIGAVEVFSSKTQARIKGKPRWRLTELMQKLYREIIGGD